MWPSWRQTSVSVSPDPTKANQKGAVSPPTLRRHTPEPLPDDEAEEEADRVDAADPALELLRHRPLLPGTGAPDFLVGSPWP